MIFPAILAHEVEIEWANTKITTYFTDNDELCPRHEYLCTSYSKDNVLHCDIYFRLDNFPTMGDIAHECIHAICACLRHIGVENINESNEEILTYLTNWLIDEINLFIKEVVIHKYPKIAICQ